MIQSVKKFIITIDTEGDGLWDWKQGDRITTENAKYLSRFQSLCNEFGFKPVWLTNYEMINDPTYVDFIAEVERDKLGELGMHLHAWNNPPEYDIKTVQNGAPYLIEYPVEIMEAKITVLTELIKKRTGITPISHRAGRWAMNDEYFRLLIKSTARSRRISIGEAPRALRSVQRGAIIQTPEKSRIGSMTQTAIRRYWKCPLLYVERTARYRPIG